MSTMSNCPSALEWERLRGLEGRKKLKKEFLFGNGRKGREQEVF